MEFPRHSLRKWWDFPRIWSHFRLNCRQKDIRKSVSHFLQGIIIIIFCPLRRRNLKNSGEEREKEEDEGKKYDSLLFLRFSLVFCLLNVESLEFLLLWVIVCGLWMHVLLCSWRIWDEMQGRRKEIKKCTYVLCRQWLLFLTFFYTSLFM